MFLIRNERLKLTANWLNALATALVAAGAFAPAAAWMYGLSQPAMAGGYVSLLVVVCFAGAGFLHVLGQAALGRLRE